MNESCHTRNSGPRTPFSLRFRLRLRLRFRFRLHFRCRFRSQIFEVHRSEAVCRDLASAQKTPQNPETSPILEKSTDLRTTMSSICPFFNDRCCFRGLQRFLQTTGKQPQICAPQKSGTGSRGEKVFEGEDKSIIEASLPLQGPHSSPPRLDLPGLTRGSFGAVYPAAVRQCRHCAQLAVATRQNASIQKQIYESNVTRLA